MLLGTLDDLIFVIDILILTISIDWNALTFTSAQTIIENVYRWFILNESDLHLTLWGLGSSISRI